MLGVKRGTVLLMPHDPDWALLFEEEKKLLMNTFGDRIKSIEHIGSTAISGIPAKPIIDMNVGIESIDNIEDFIQKLPGLGYEYIPERRFSDRQFFPKGPAEERTHHLNLVEMTSETGWTNPLLFRDYLRKHQEVREAYQRLKEGLVLKYADNRDEYTERKGSFIHSVLEKARQDSLD